jgi:hypothetical protein
VKTVLAGAAAASFALGALAATAVSATVAAPTTSFFRPMYVFNQKLGTTTFAECEEKCPELSGKDFKKGQMTIPCITSFDMNHQLLAWMTKKYGPVWKSTSASGAPDNSSLDPAVRAAAPQIFEHQFFTRTGLDDLHKVVRRKKKKTVSHADAAEARRQAEVVAMGVCDREALQAERHALATRVAELERQLAAFQPAAQVTAPSSRAGSMDISPA